MFVHCTRQFFHPNCTSPQAFLAALYLGPLALLANIVFWVSMATLAAWIGIKYRGDKPEIAEKIDEIAEIIWEQVLGKSMKNVPLLTVLNIQ